MLVYIPAAFPRQAMRYAMNRIPIAILLAVAACSARAQQAAPVNDVDAASKVQVEAKAVRPGDARASEDPNCLRYTGSRLGTAEPRRARRSGGTRCVNASGRSYDREALDSTGENDPARALQKLDPSISIRR